MTRTIIISASLIFILQVVAFGQSSTSCSAFQQLVKETYTFKPAKLTDSERETKSAAMDRVWSLAKKDREKLLPCLRTAVHDAKADKFFLFDGSNLLVELDPSPESKAVQVRNYAAVDLEDVNLRVWVVVLANRALEDFDTSKAAARWLAHREAVYYLPEHGAYGVGPLEGGLFLYGSMPESLATPALTSIASQINHPGRSVAIRLLMDQATPESLRVLKALNQAGLSSKQQKSLREFLEKPKLLTPRAQPKTSRAEFIKAFEQLLEGSWREFLDLVEQVPDGEKDLIAVMQAEDIPLLRKVRRRVIANGTPHAIEFYQSFTAILRTLMMKYEVGNLKTDNIRASARAGEDVRAPDNLTFTDH
jgi:hypothetical protein